MQKQIIVAQQIARLMQALSVFSWTLYYQPVKLMHEYLTVVPVTSETS